MKRSYSIIAITLLSLYVIITGTWLIRDVTRDKAIQAEQQALRQAERAQEMMIRQVIDARKPNTSDDDARELFDKNGKVHILLIGIDSRVGQINGNCDAIQLITIDKKNTRVDITAVPRGTYSPLPPGTGATSSDYYISNACGKGGLEYGITQIERILGVRADHLVIVGFSETLGILRTLRLPTTQTLQWLRHRQSYAIGEPQRARNHSTFIKQMLIKYTPEQNTTLNAPLHFLVYKLIKTDLSFAEARELIQAIADMDIANNPERIRLSMRPTYAVQDIPYDPDHIDEQLANMINPIRHLLSRDDHTDQSTTEVQQLLLEKIENGKNDQDFIQWAYTHNLWSQIEDDETRMLVHFDLMKRFVAYITDAHERQALLADYILEMEYRGEAVWARRGQLLLTQEIEE